MLAAGALWVLLALAPGDPAPSVDLVDLQGRRLSVEPAGRVVIVDFFATWCPGCRRSLVDYRSIVEALGDRALIVLVDVEEPAALVRAFFARYRLPEGVILARDPRGVAMHRFGATGFPSLYVIDPTGTIRHVRSGWGGGSAASLVAAVQRMQGAPASEPVRTAARPVRAAARSRGRAAPEPTTEIVSPDERARRLGVEIVH